VSRTVFAVATLIVLVLTGAAAWLNARPRLDHGLRQSVYQTAAFDGTPISQRTSSDLSLGFLDRDPSLPRHFFSARWEGFWFVDRDRAVPKFDASRALLLGIQSSPLEYLQNLIAREVPLAKVVILKCLDGLVDSLRIHASFPRAC
jgi:hypothetical protein